MAKGNGKPPISRRAHPGTWNIQNNPSLTAMAFFLPAAFADINIDKSRSVYYWLGKSNRDFHRRSNREGIQAAIADDVLDVCCCYAVHNDRHGRRFRVAGDPARPGQRTVVALSRLVRLGAMGEL